MSIIDREPEILTNPLVALPQREQRIDIASKIANREIALSVLFPDDEVRATTKEMLDSTGFYDKADGRRWALFVTNGDSPESDLAESVLTDVFSTERFKNQHPAAIARDYGHYKPASLFISVIDTEHPDGPRPVSAIQAVKNSIIGCKSINTLADSDPTHNPWYDYISRVVGDWGKGDEIEVAEIIRKAYDVDLSETWSIESMAALPEYAGKHGLFGEASFPLYAICLQMSDRAGIRSWLSIQDLKPLLQMQRIFAKPWEVLDLPVREYDGSQTIPTVIRDMPLAQSNLREADPGMGEMLIDGKGLANAYVTPEELFGEDYLQDLANNL